MKADYHCRVEDCNDVKYTNKTLYCCRHDFRYRKHGDPLYVSPKIKRKKGLTYADHKLYGTWQAMKNRVYNPNAWDYKYYGARGITVCDRWKSDFGNFLEDMGERPSDLHTLDRIDPNGDYSPENCRWATPYKQSVNKRQRGTSNITGVAYIKKHKRWRARLISGGIKQHESFHTNENDAIEARRMAETKLLLKSGVL